MDDILGDILGDDDDDNILGGDDDDEEVDDEESDEGEVTDTNKKSAKGTHRRASTTLTPTRSSAPDLRRTHLR